MERKITILIIILGLFSAANAAIINVPGNYSTIQAAINAAQNHDTILVEPGTYMENINFRGKNIVITSRYYIGNDPAFIHSTIIDGSQPTQPDSASCVIIGLGEDSTTVFQGFTLTGGTGTKWRDIHNTMVYREGGGILIEFSRVTVQNNIIINNFAINTQGVSSAGGGGIRIGDANPRILNNIIINNTGRYGPGIVLNYTGCVIRNNVIASNYGATSFGGGSGIWCFQNLGTTPKIIENNAIVNNSSSTVTGGVYVSASNVVLRNNIVWGNSPAAQLSVSGGTIVAYCDVQGGWPGAGNINSDPAFNDSNYVLLSSSPCVDKGDSSTIYNDTEDPQNPGNAMYPSRGTVRNDMGAYGGPGARILSNQLIGIKEINSNVPHDFTLYQNYPNPFNPITKIKFDVPPVGNTYMRSLQLRIYDVLGCELAVLVNQQLKPGTYEVEWDASKYSSGIYFYSLIADGVSYTKKMMLVK